MKRKERGKVDKKTLQGSIINTMFRDGFSVYRTENVTETIYFIERLMDKVLKDKKCVSNLLGVVDDSKLDYIDTKVLSKKKCLTPDMFGVVRPSNIEST